MELIIGCVGKPSAGKSTFFNAVTESNAKTGDFPFTTIEPNIGVTYYRCECPCKSRGKSCNPKYGRCVKGTRQIPIKLLDVAGLIPGASEGLGLGNVFLNDLRGASVLLHVVDISGTTNEKGEKTRGYDPQHDIDWLNGEILSWVFNNLYKRWDSIVRRHTAAKETLCNTLQAQLGGYGANRALVVQVVTALGYSEPVDLTVWTKEDVMKLVQTFVDIRFKTIYILNKVDQGADCDKNITKILRKYDPDRCFVCSSLTECFLKRALRKKLISYSPGADDFTISETADRKMKKRLEHLQSMVMYRFGGTGVWDAVQAAVESLEPVVAYPVKSLTSFSCSGSGGGAVFATACLLRKGATMADVGRMISGRTVAYADDESGQRISAEEIVTRKNFVMKFTFEKEEEESATSKS